MLKTENNDGKNRSVYGKVVILEPVLKIKAMATLRFRALSELVNKKAERFSPSTENISRYFSENVFDRAKMRQYLAIEAYDAVVDAVEEGRRIDRKVADQIAAGMKAWSMDRGATHYAHWFQPLNDSTAEKHDSFFEPLWNGGSVEAFKGSMLVQQEPDASSFPNGGLRNTFEARGYTAWDPSSPAFVLEGTLCIPTIFVAYTGEALDFKTPHIKSLTALDKAASEVCQYFDKDVSKVNVTLGWEQEYFIVDEGLFLARPDLMITGRTLMGNISAKDQQLEDHYFGSIPDRVKSFMEDFEVESYRLGIPLKTRHNEVAPNQYECAPMFEEANLAVDHNLLLMTVMHRVARRHKLRVLFHEKPFKGINGSGKHANWSMITNTGVNLLSPGKTPKTNIQFLTFLINTMKAVDEHSLLLLSSIASFSNSHRLGGNEAPPSIMSVFLGSTLSAILDQIEERISDKKLSPDEKTEIKLDIGRIPDILLDNTDRNRTSPFAFTGNRFEFRAVGSSSNTASPLLVLNSAVAQQLVKFKKEVDAIIEKTGLKKDEAILQVLRQIIVDCKKIRFEGNGYSQEWVVEAAKRGLSSIPDLPAAFKAFLDPKSVALFEEFGVLSIPEIHSRIDIRLEAMEKKIQIESRLLGDLAINHIIPTAVKYQNTLIENLRGMKEIFGDESQSYSLPQIETLKQISEHVMVIRNKVNEMIEERKVANNIEELEEKADAYYFKVLPFFEEIRYHIDKLETLIDDELWPLPKYRELLLLN